MDILIYDGEEKVNIISFTKGLSDYQLVANKTELLREGCILVFRQENEEEFLGIVTETETNKDHIILYIELNPNLENQFNYLKTKSVLLWGVL